MRKLISLLTITLMMFIAAASGVYAHQMIGIKNASVSPTVAAPGDPLLVSFQYDTNHWAHSAPWTPWTNDGWRLLWDGLMPSIASGLGPGSHPVDNVIKTYSVNTTINVPVGALEGAHTLSIGTDNNAGLPGSWGCGAGCHLGDAQSLDLDLKIVKKAIIDIKPGSFPNSINLGKKGVIPVAIFTTSKADGDAVDFDVTDIDVGTVTFGPGNAPMVHKKAHLSDIDGDGDTDMVLHFDTAAAQIAAGDTSADINGKLLNGKEFKGSDSVRTISK